MMLLKPKCLGVLLLSLFSLSALGDDLSLAEGVASTSDATTGVNATEPNALSEEQALFEKDMEQGPAASESDPVPLPGLVGPGPQQADFTKDVLPDLLSLREQFWAYVESLKTQIGDDEVLRLAKTGALKITKDGVGYAKGTVIGSTIILRIVHESSEIAYVFSDKDVEGSLHLAQYLASQIMYAGKSRPSQGWLKTFGRDVVLISMDGSTQTLSKARFWQAQYWKDFYQANNRPITTNQVAFGVFCGVAQTALGLGVSLANHALHPGSNFSWAAPILSLVFGTTIGIKAPLYRNITSRGNFRVAKSQVVSLAFSYSLMMLTKGSASVLNIFDFNGFFSHTYGWWSLWKVAAQNHAHIFWNAWINNKAKDSWYQLPILRNEYLRLNPTPLVVGPFTFSRSDTEFQSIYLVPFAGKLADLTDMSVPVLGTNLPVGIFIQTALWPIADYMLYRKTKNLDAETLLEKSNPQIQGEDRVKLKAALEGSIEWAKNYYAQRWRNTRRLPLTLTGHVARMVKKWIWGETPCNSMLSAKNT